MTRQGVFCVLICSLAVTSCATSDVVRSSGSPMAQADSLVATSAEGVELALPKDATGPLYDSDDYFRARPTWEGASWHVHFVYGNGGLTEFMDGARCFSLDDELMHRKVCVGNYMYYGIIADISRLATPGQVTSMQVTIEPNGLTEAQALAVVRSATTTWELSSGAD